MKQILLVAISAGLLFFGVGLYQAHGEESPSPVTPSQPNNATTPKQYVVPVLAQRE